MISYDQFKAEWNNRYIDADGAYGNQCADLITQYARETGMPHLYGNAADAANQYSWPHVSSPLRGDVVVFARSPANGQAGHIAICDRDGNGHYTFGQNYPTGSNCHLQYVPDQIISILRPNLTQGENVSNIQEEVRLTNLFNQANYKLAEREYLYRGIDASDSQKRKWITVHPVDAIIQGIEAEVGPIRPPGAAEQKLAAIEKLIHS